MQCDGNHKFFRNRFGELQCSRCGFKVKTLYLKPDQNLSKEVIKKEIVVT